MASMPSCWPPVCQKGPLACLQILQGRLSGLLDPMAGLSDPMIGLLPLFLAFLILRPSGRPLRSSNWTLTLRCPLCSTMGYRPLQGCCPITTINMLKMHIGAPGSDQTRLCNWHIRLRSPLCAALSLQLSTLFYWGNGNR